MTNLPARLLHALVCAWLVGATFLLHQAPQSVWPLGVAVGLLVASALATQLRALQPQNVFVAAALTLVVGSSVIWLNSRTSIPFGPRIFSVRCGAQLLDGLPLAPPLFWLAALVTARGVARLVLRPWRKLRTYGFRVMGLTAALVTVLDLGVEPFAAQANHLWLWQPTNLPWTWFGAPLINFASQLLVTLFTLAVITPWLINKMPSGKKRPPDFHPLILWQAMNLFLAVNLAAHSLWLAVAVVGIQTVVVSSLAWKNAR
jgi:uncharacterized membrane protein